MTSVYAPDGNIYEDVYFNGTSGSVDTDFTTDWFTCNLITYLRGVGKRMMVHFR